MKKLLITSSFLLSFTMLQNKDVKPIGEELKEQIKELVNDGYSYQWAIKKALVENNIIKPDAEYLSIIED